MFGRFLQSFIYIQFSRLLFILETCKNLQIICFVDIQVFPEENLLRLFLLKLYFSICFSAFLVEQNEVKINYSNRSFFYIDAAFKLQSSAFYFNNFSRSIDNKFIFLRVICLFPFCSSNKLLKLFIWSSLPLRRHIIHCCIIIFFLLNCDLEGLYIKNL